MKTVAYVPWKGYFDLIAFVYEFILFDDLQYTRRDWRDLNQIKTPQGLQWLTVPVRVKGKYFQAIRDAEIDGGDWALAHWKALVQNYRREPHFESVAGWLEPLYLGPSETHLSQLNRRLIESVCAYRGIRTRLCNSWGYELHEGQTERLAQLCRQAGGQAYVSGASARDYIDEQVFEDMDIRQSWFDYGGFLEHHQLGAPFTHNVTILDLLFNCGPEAHRYMKHVQT